MVCASLRTVCAGMLTNHSSATNTWLIMDDLVAIVGQSISSALAQAVVHRFGSRSTDEQQKDFFRDLERRQDVELTEHYWSNVDQGILIRHNPEGRIDTLFVYLVAEEGYAPFRGKLVAGLDASASRAEVRSELGVPSRFGEAFKDSILGPQGAWDRYDSERISLHFRYVHMGEGIRRITVMAADTAP